MLYYLKVIIFLLIFYSNSLHSQNLNIVRDAEIENFFHDLSFPIVESSTIKGTKINFYLDKQNYSLTYSNLYGTRIEDKELSLGLTDSYRLHAVYESNDDNDPVGRVENAYLASLEVADIKTKIIEAIKTEKLPKANWSSCIDEAVEIILA